MQMHNAPSNRTSTDYVVVGAGSAGSVVVRRLVDAGHKVTVLEAGPTDDHEALHDPAGDLMEVFGGGYAWPYTYTPQRYSGGREIAHTAGRTLGGGSAINGYLYVRGVPADYDHWAALGARGWEWSAVEPYFRRLENYVGGPDATGRGMGGPVGVTRAPKLNAAATAWLDAATEAGLPYLEDYNVGDSEGVARAQQIIADGRRTSAWSSYVRPIQSNPLLTVVTDATVTNLVFDGNRVIGVDYQVGGPDGEPTRILAESEVIVSAGAVGTPKVLMLSGIGDADELRRLGLPVHAHLPGVGRNFMDHPAVPIVYETREPVGPAGTAFADANAFLRTYPGLPTPDVQAEYLNVVYPTAAVGRALPEHGFTIVAMLMHPLSRGTVTLRSANPFDIPLSNPNFYMEPADLDTLIDSFEQLRHIGAQPAMAALVKGEARPGPDLTDREALRQYARATTTSSYHPAGTAKMGVDNLAVVDPELRVHGVDGLRVADLSIIPTLTTGNTNAPAMMIGERAADFILRG